MVLNKTTKLDAVNTMLTSVGSQPVASLTSLSADVLLAVHILDEVTREILMLPWHFNTEEEVVYMPDATTSKITVAENVLAIDAADRSIDTVLRGNTVYDRKNKTEIWTKNLKLNVIYLLDFEECPQSCRHFLAIRAARRFQDRMKGSEKHHRFTQEDEVRAHAIFQQDNSLVANYNIKNSDVGYGIIGNRISTARRMRRV